MMWLMPDRLVRSAILGGPPDGSACGPARPEFAALPLRQLQKNDRENPSAGLSRHPLGVDKPHGPARSPVVSDQVFLGLTSRRQACEVPHTPAARAVRQHSGRLIRFEI